MGNTLLSIKNLKVSFFTREGEVKAVDDISYDVEYAEVMGIVGESGSGKSVSAFSIVNLLDEPGKIIGGQILFEDKDLVTISDKEMRKKRGKEIAFIFQDPMTCLNPVFTIGNQLSEAIKLYFPKYTKVQIKERAAELLTLAGINEVEKRLKQYPFEFSGGMRQRAMIAMALAGNPKLLLADEPTTALDVTIQSQILDLLKDIQNKTNMSIIFITHDLGLINSFAHRVNVVYGGKIVETGYTKDIINKPSHPYTIGLLESIPHKKDKGSTLKTIGGSPIDLLNSPCGCPFSPRCSHSMQICIQQMPPFFTLGDRHVSACWLHHKDCNANDEGEK
jgi:oligopeptide transport system ATP-binding protein